MKNSLAKLLVGLLLAVAGGAAVQAQYAPGQKVFRYAFNAAETGFDPAQLSDLYSRIVTENIFDCLYTYDYLARPVKVRPNLADGMPVISADFTTYTVKIKPGIYFDDDPAFGGKKRELTAHDVVYTYKRIFDPVTKSQLVEDLAEDQLIGTDSLRKEAEKPGAKFNYDKEIEGIRALDRYTVQFKSSVSRPRFIYQLSDAGIYGTVAREVVEKYGDKIMEHPVGTGPFKLHEWRRSSKIVLVRNPNFRESYYEAEPAADDARAQAIYARYKGKRIPLVDRVEVSIIEEEQPRTLAFMGSEHDLLERLPASFAKVMIPNNKLAPNLVKRGIGMQREASPDIALAYFNMEDPLVGGYTPEKVALRRAISLAYNGQEEISRPRSGQAIPAQGPIQPMTYGYDPNLKTEASEYNPAKAKALLDMFGYVDKDGDGWRDMPDGSPLVLEYATTSSSQDRALTEVWRKYMDQAGLKMRFKVGKWPEHLQAARAGKLMMWGLGYSAASPDGSGALQLAYGPGKGEANLPRFEHKEFDQLYLKSQVMGDGPERLALMQRMVRIMIAYMPYKFTAHRILTDLTQPWMLGYVRHPVSRNFWRFVDIDAEMQEAALR